MKKLRIVLQSNYFYIALCFITIGYLLISINIINKKETIYEDYYEGIVKDIQIDNDKITFTLKGKQKVIGYYLNDEKTDYYKLLGNKVLINGNIINVNNNTIPNNFNYKEYLINHNIRNIYNINSYQVTNSKINIYYLKYIIIKRINSFDNKIKPYLNLFLLGNKSQIDENVQDYYRTNGIWHLFAISGMHINTIIMLLTFILKRSKHQTIIISVFLLLFMFITNFSASTQRTCIFYYLVNIFKYLKLDKNNFKILILTVVTIVIINPFIIYDNGFRYSFLITLAIILQKKYITGNYIQKLLKISFISFLVSLPITINNNYEINIFSPLFSIIYVPYITFIVFPFSIITILFKPFNSIFKLFINILEISNKIVISYKFNIIIPKLSIIIIIIYYIILIIYHKTTRKLYLFLIINLLLINVLVTKLDSSRKVIFFDVNQGDSISIIDNHNSNVTMIDTGGNINSNYNYSNKIITYYKSIGIGKINTLILTHGDYDHMGEAINLVENFKVEKVIFNCGEFNDLEKELIKVLDKKKIPYYSCIKELNIDDNKLYFLQTTIYDNENDNSNVIYTEIDGYKFMFMGDAGINKEKDILDKYNISNVDVLKVGHHGSKTSSSKEFINEINPQYSIISVGKNNRYGHPNKEVLNTLENSKIYRTDEDGSIMFKIMNNKLKVETCSP